MGEREREQQVILVDEGLTRKGLTACLESWMSASSMDLKRIQTPHNLLRDFRADRTFTLVGLATNVISSTR